MYINTIEYAIRYHQWSVSTICLYQHANHVPQTSVISLMICLYHEPSATTMYLNQSSVSTISSHISCTKVYAKQVIPMVYFSQVLSSKTYTIYECINIALNMYHHLYQASASTMHQYHNKMNYNQDVSSYMYAISTIKHVPIILLVGASNNVPKVYQSCINYRSSYDSSMMYNMTTSSTHQLHVPICSPSICQMHAPRYPTNMLPIIHHKIYQ
jgi:hypothetical protein